LSPIIKLAVTCTGSQTPVAPARTRVLTKWVAILVALAAAFSCVSCEEGNYGNVYVENHGSTEIVVQYPPGGKPSAPIPAHSTRLAIAHVLLGTRMTLTDIRDAHTNKLMFNSAANPTSRIEGRWFDHNDLHISYRPKD